MSRVKFLENKQSSFLEKIMRTNNLDLGNLAEICNVDKRTLFDWRRDRYQMSYASFQLLRRKLKTPDPKIEVLPDGWNNNNAARLGGIRRNELYGNPGTPEGRRKGGLTTWKSYVLNPAKFVNSGFIGPKEIQYPRKSVALAELVGIILGDGSITKYHLVISLNSKVEENYSYYVAELIKELFGLTVTRELRENNTCNLVISGVKLIGYLNELGLKTGHKIHQQVSIPKWIMENKKFRIACLRGLVDTDGGVYYHNHVTKGIRYRHLGLCFTSYSAPLLRDAHGIFLSLGLPAKLRQAGNVFLYDRRAIKRYFTEVGTHNTHHLQRYRDYFRFGEVPKRS